MKKVSLVILNWNGKKDTFECLKSISALNLKTIDLSVIVVDNASTDDSVKSFKKLKPKKYKLEILENDENLGFSGGNNVGITYSLAKDFDYIILLNNDTRLHRNLIQEFIKSANRNKDWGIISPKIYFEKGFEFHKKYNKKELGKIFWSAGGEIDWDNVFGVNRGVDEVDKGQYNNEEKIEFATGACMLINPKAIEKTGQFDERYFLYFEDLDLSMKMTNNHFDIVYSPKSVLWHKVSQSSSIGGELNDYFITRNRMLFTTLYAPLKTRVAVLRQSLSFIVFGREWQRRGVIDFLSYKFGKGSWQN